MSAGLQLHVSCLKGTDFLEDNKVPNCPMETKRLLADLFCLWKQRKTAHTPKSEDGVCVSSPYGLFGSKWKKSFLRLKGRPRTFSYSFKQG